MPLTLGWPAGQAPEYDRGLGWQGLLVLVLLAREATTGLFLLAGEGPNPGDLGQQVAVVGDLEQDIPDEVSQVRRGRKPSHH
jgi:hypothetical protein